MTELMTAEKRISVPKIIGYTLHLVGIEFWIVAVGPFYLGWGIGSESLWPNGTVILGGVVIGPLLGSYTFLFNDWADMPLDEGHRRKVVSPLWLGLVEARTVLFASLVMCGLGILLAFSLDTTFGIISVLIALLSGIYSYPATKWKAKGGYDLFTNMVGIGILCPIGGWVLAGRALSSFPLWYLFSLTAIMGAMYAPTTVADYAIDRKGGLNTLAIRIGPRNTIHLAQLLMLIGFGSMIVEAWFDYVLTRAILFRVWPFLVMQPIIYFAYLRNPTYSRILTAFISTSIVSGIGSVMFLAYLSGVWQA